jgi:E3 ubiquitin-protein ligase RNF128
MRTDGVVSTTGINSIVRNGQAFILTDAYGYFDGCQQPINPLNYSNGIAIIQRGGNCTFSVKITRAKQYGAAGKIFYNKMIILIFFFVSLAVMIYDPLGSDLFNMLQNNSDMLCVYVHQSTGSFLFNITKNPRTQLNITLQPIQMDYDDYNPDSIWFGSQSATVFIAISICILISLCISWLIFYYCQRHRARTAKDRLQNRLSNAAKKALTKIPLVNITEPSPNDESCVICLDTIKTGDTVRQLGIDNRLFFYLKSTSFVLSLWSYISSSLC